MSDEQKHTPGPWAVEYHTDSGKPRSIKALPDMDHVTFVDDSRYYDQQDDPEAVANARLIAAAPELLEACKRAVRSMRDGFEENTSIEDRQAWEQECMKAMQELNAVIGKAEYSVPTEPEIKT